MKLSKLIFRTTFIVAFTSIIVASIISIFFQYNNYLLDNKYIHDEFTQNNKELIKNEVNKVLEYIYYRQAKIQKEHKNASLEEKSQLEEQLKEEILEWIATLRYGKDNYIFVNTIQGYGLLFNGKKLDEPFYWKEDDVFQQELKASMKEEGDYFYYKFKKLNGQKEFPKMAYVVRYKPWDWIVGSGVYIDEIEEKLAIKNEKLKSNILYQVYFLQKILL